MILLAALTISQTQLMNEEMVLDCLVRAWTVAIVSGTPPELGTVTRRAILIESKKVSAKFGNVSVSWDPNSGRIGSIDYPIGKLPAEGSPPKLSLEDTRAKAKAAIRILMPSKYAFDMTTVVESDRTTAFFFEVILGNYPIGSAVSSVIELDNRTGDISRYYAIGLRRDVHQLSASNVLPIATLKAVAEQTYSANTPLPYAELDVHGFRITIPQRSVNRPAPGLNYIAWFNPSYAAKSEQEEPILVFSISFGWQNVLVDAISGVPIQLFGFDMGNARGKGAEISIPLSGWACSSAPNVTGTLEKSEAAWRCSSPKNVVVYNGDHALSASFDSEKGLIRVGERLYSVSRNLADALRKQVKSKILPG